MTTDGTGPARPKLERAAFLVNAKARRGREWAARLKSEVQARGGQPLLFQLADSPVAMTTGLLKALEGGAEWVFVAGGDGTVREAARALTGSTTVLGILPFGTGNSLARELGVPVDPVQSLRFHLETAQERPIDVGDFAGNTFMNVLTFGLTSRIVEQIGNLPKSKLGRWVYLPAVARAVGLVRPRHIRVATESEAFEGRVVQFVAGNSRLHAGPFPVTREAAIDDGLLSMYVVEARHRADLFKYGAMLLIGRHTSLPSVWATDSPFVDVTLDRKRKFVLDGDTVAAAAGRAQVHTRSLRVLASPVSP